MFWSGNSVTGLLGSLTLLLQLLLPPETARRWESMEDLEIRVNSVNLKTYIYICLYINPGKRSRSTWGQESYPSSTKYIQICIREKNRSMWGQESYPSFIYTGKRSLNQVIWSVCFEILKGQGWIQTSRESDAFGLSGSNKGGKTKPEIESLKSYLFNPPTPIHFGTSLVYSCFLWKHLSFEVPHYALK